MEDVNGTIDLYPFVDSGSARDGAREMVACSESIEAMAKMKSRIPTVRQTLKSTAEMEYWNNYIYMKLGVDIQLAWKYEAEVMIFNDLYRKDWLDKPVNKYCDTMVKYLNLVGTSDR